MTNISRKGSLRGNIVLIADCVLGLSLTIAICITKKSLDPIYVMALIGWVMATLGWGYANMYEKKL